jgi:hypothetical protein
MAEHKPRAIRLVEDPWATVRHVVEVVAVIAAGVWAFYTFIYQEKIKPASEPASLDDTITVQRVGHDRTRDIIEVAIHLHNGGKTEIAIAADGYNVWGDRYATAVTHTTLDASHVQWVNNDYPRISRRLIQSFVELRDAAAGGQPGKYTTLEPDGVVTIPSIIVIPRGVYDVIHAQVTAVPAKTPIRQRISVQVIHNTDGSIFLRSLTPGTFEDDNSIDFGLLPE